MLLSVITVYLYSEDYPVLFYSWLDYKFICILFLFVLLIVINLLIHILLFTCLF